MGSHQQGAGCRVRLCHCQHGEAGEPSELKQAMIMMTQSVSAMAKCQQEKASTGVEHFMAERTLKRTRRVVMMPDHYRFSDKYNEIMDTMLLVEDRKLECEFQLRELRANATVDLAAVTKTRLVSR